MWNDNIIIIKAGQFITGRKQLSEETGISESTVERILNMFEKEQQIEQQKTTKYRLITVINWTNHQNKESGEQQSGQQADSKRTASGQQADTNKNDKKIKNNKNLNSEELNSVLREWNAFAKENSLPEIMKITTKRKSSIERRLKEADFNLYKIFERIKRSDFLLGKKTDWKVDFDFVFCSSNNYLKILEGKYNGRTERGFNAEKYRKISESIANDPDLK